MRERLAAATPSAGAGTAPTAAAAATWSGAKPARSPLARELLCGICLCDLLEGGIDLGELDVCNHRYCFPCISKWAEIENSCPYCKQRFSRLRRKRLAPRPVLLAGGDLDPATELPGTYVDSQQVEERNQRVAFEDPTFQQWIDDLACLACGGDDDEDQLLLCDECDRACHAYCAGLDAIPEGQWFCPACTQRRQRSRRAVRPASRRRQRVIGDDEEEEQTAGQGRRRTAQAAPAGRRAAMRRSLSGPAGAADGDLSDFVVPDGSDGEDEWLSDEPAAGGAGQRRRRLRRGRRAAQPPSQSTGSDESTHDRFGDSESEINTTGSSSEDEGIAGTGNEEDGEEDRPLLSRLQGRRGGRQPARRALGAQQRRSAGGRPRRGGAAAAAEAGPTQAHRDVSALAASWEDLRRGSTTFAAVRRSGPAGGARAGRAPQRRRLVRAGDLSDGAAGPAAGGRAAADIVDLLSSPSPGSQTAGRTTRGAAAAAAQPVEERQAWEAMEAALVRGGQQQGSGAGGGRRRRQAESPAGADEGEDDLDVPLAVRISRQIASARQRGALLAPRQQQQQQQAYGSAARGPPHSANRRTVRDMRLMAAAARGTPGSGGASGGGGSGDRAFQIPRMASLEGGGRDTGRSPPQPQQQVQAQPCNPFTRFQLSGGGGSGASPWQPDAGRRSGGDGSLHASSHSRFCEQQQPYQQVEAGPHGRQYERNSGSPKPLRQRAQPAPPPPPHLQQPGPWQERGQPWPRASPAPGGSDWRQPPVPQARWDGLGGGSPAAAASPGFTPVQHLHPPPSSRPPTSGHAGWSPASASWGKGGSRSPGSNFAVRPAVPQPPSAGYHNAEGSGQPPTASLPPPHAASIPPPPPPGRPAAQHGAPQPLPAQHDSRPNGAARAGAAAGCSGAAEQPQLSKQQIMDQLKPFLKQRLARGQLNRETYKLAARVAVASLFERQRPFTDAEAERAVHQALRQLAQQ